MIRLPFTVQAQISGCHDEGIILPDEDPRQVLIEGVIQAINLDVIVKVGDVEMPLAMWEDPGHWAENWAEELGCEHSEAEQQVADLIGGALEERP